MRLTDLRINSFAAPPKGQKTYLCDTLPGFGVRVSQGGTKTFVLMVGRERQLVSIGRYPIISLADARQVARERLAERTLGKHRPARLRMSEALTRFFAEKEAKNKASTLAITRGILNTHFKHLHARNLDEITAGDLARITDALLAEAYPSAANHAQSCGRTFFKWCARRGYIHHSPMETIERPARLVSRERVLTDDELRTVWKAAETTGGNFGKITQLLILTGQRRSEIGSLQTSWLSFSSSQASPTSSGNVANICIPSEYTKNKRSHTFPIGSFATSILKDPMEGSSTGYLFPARGKQTISFNGWSKAKAQLDKKVAETYQNPDNLIGLPSKPINPWTLHDLRRTYATNLQRLGIKLEVIEALLNHVSGTRAGIVGVYQKHRWETEMREAVTTFDDWFTKTITSK